MKEISKTGQNGDGGNFLTMKCFVTCHYKRRWSTQVVSFQNKPKSGLKHAPSLENVLSAIGFCCISSISEECVLMYAPLLPASFWDAVNEIITSVIGSRLIVFELNANTKSLRGIGGAQGEFVKAINSLIGDEKNVKSVISELADQSFPNDELLNIQYEYSNPSFIKSRVEQLYKTE